MKVGDLVRVLHATDGVPFGAIAVIYRIERSNFDEFNIYDVVLIGSERSTRRLGDDLEILNENR